jgi:hypothetical protein
MKGLRARLRRIADRLTGRRADLAKSRRRHKIWREHAEELDAKALRAKNHGHSLRAAAFERRAARAHVKALYWKERVRRDDKAIERLEKIEDGLEDDLKKLEAHVHFEGHNKIRGGSYEQRAKAAMARAMLNDRNGTGTIGERYYSMEGRPRVYSHTLWHYPQGHIWDCSTYADGTCFVTGDPSPSGPHGYTLGGWTGTELENCKRIKESEAKVGDLVIYLGGSMGSHHVERIYDPEKKRTSGHGDSRINIGCDGSYDLFGDGNFAVVRPPRDDHEHNLPA